MFSISLAAAFREPVGKSVVAAIILFMLTGMIGTLNQAAIAEEVQVDASDLAELSLEDLANIEVTLASKRPESAFETPAAVYVITQDEIRRSGMSNIAELLRLVPGMQVGQIDSNKWAISARGFNDRFANKMLVLIDGRSVYTPLFSGVYWDVQDLVLEDIERIEVIRGPGGTLWGANAVNGIVNVITKYADSTQDLYATQSFGTEENSTGALRFGGRFGETGSYRFYTKYSNVENGVFNTGLESNDSWDRRLAGLRFDWSASQTDNYTVLANVYRSVANSIIKTPILGLPPTEPLAPERISASGGSILARLQRTHSDNSDSELQLYYDRSERTETMYSETRNTIDIDFQHSFAARGNHELMVGMGYRYSADETEDTTWVRMNPESYIDHVASAFIQDSITLKPDRVKLTLGSKFEHNSFTGYELQPSIKLLYTPDEKRALWTSVTRAVRTPARVDRGVDIFLDVADAPLPPLPIHLISDGMIDTEKMIAYEIGYRTQPSKRLVVDVAAFYNDYTDLLGAVQQMVGPPVPGINLLVRNTTDLATYGGEVALRWNVNDKWRLVAAHSITRSDIKSNTGIAEGAEFSGLDDDQFQIRSYYDLNDEMQFDLALYHIGRNSEFDLPAYNRLDARLAWKQSNDTEYILGVRNALDSTHLEGGTGLTEKASLVERSVYMTVSRFF